MSTIFLKKSKVEHAWYVVDADGQVLGRLASRVARILTGKHKPTYLPFLDSGDHVVVVNAEKVLLTGRKEGDKLYIHHTGYPGGLRQFPAGAVRGRHPERLIEQAVRGMLPKTRLGRAQFRKLKVYAGPDHPHQAQGPRAIVLRKGTEAAPTAAAEA